MSVNNEEAMVSKSDLLELHEHNKIEKYIHIDKNIQTINRTGPYDDVSLHVASYLRSNKNFQVLLTNNALKSLKNNSYELLSYDEIHKLCIKHSNEEIQDEDYIDWSLVGDNLIKKRQEFREKIDLYKTYDNQHHLIAKLLFEIIEYYLNEYLIQQENFSPDEISRLEDCFRKAIEEQNYLKYFIKAYTLANNFYRILNRHLALYVLDYFDTFYSSPTKYRLINCLVHIITLLINHPDIHKYTYKGIAYRGLSMTENDLKNYSIGNHILNRSFVSTSKDCSIAQIFADNSHQTSGKISVLLKYTIKQDQTAIDIEHISSVTDEKEVLILPFSVFQVKDRIENIPNMCSSVLVEIDLEECEDDQQINKKKHKSKQLTNIRYQRKKMKNIVGLKCVVGSIVSLFILATLIIAVTLTKKEKSSKDECPTMINRTTWNAYKPTGYTILSSPVPYIAILHTAGKQCKTLDSCISIVQDIQKFHMNTKGWVDIGYNFLVGGDGYIYEGRGWNYIGSHCRDYNSRSIGIGVIGNFTSIEPSKSYKDAVHSLINCGKSLGFIQKDYTLVGHWDVGIVESFMVSLNKSHQHAQYCSPPTTTVGSNSSN